MMPCKTLLGSHASTTPSPINCIKIKESSRLTNHSMAPHFPLFSWPPLLLLSSSCSSFSRTNLHVHTRKHQTPENGLKRMHFFGGSAPTPLLIASPQDAISTLAGAAQPHPNAT